MPYIGGKLERHWCWECKKTSLHIARYSKDKSKVKLICPLCKHTSVWSISVYPNPLRENTDKQIDYILKDIKGVFDV